MRARRRYSPCVWGGGGLAMKADVVVEWADGILGLPDGPTITLTLSTPRIGGNFALNWANEWGGGGGMI